MSNFTRRKFLGMGALALPAALGANSTALETTTLRVTKFTRGPGPCRFVHFSDFHYKGDAEFAGDVVRTINALSPDFVCFTGDLVEEGRFAADAFRFIGQIEAPVYGAPGNHDYNCGIPFTEYAAAFAATGGAWLENRGLTLDDHDIDLFGFGRRGVHAFTAPRSSREILLLHYPQVANGLGRRFDLILAGHSHGGQVRVPFVGALVLPKGVGPYEHGFYETPGGPLYVNAGIGTYRIPFRWNCRPEITLVCI